MSRAIFLAGLGFGDEGKGTMVDFLTKKEQAHTVVRYNGGAQAAHNVITEDGRHHTFSQFGSGTFHGARTFLSRHVLVAPVALLREAKHLVDQGVKDPLKMMYIDRDAPLITTYHRAANKIRETARKKEGNPHGTCGWGIGEVRNDFLRYPDMMPRIGDLENPSVLKNKLSIVQALKKIELEDLLKSTPPIKGEAWDSFQMLEESPAEAIKQYGEFHKLINLVDQDFLRGAMSDGVTIFEGAQGVLLDETFGFQPHTTWTNITFDNAWKMVQEAGFGNTIDIDAVGVIRSYMTRHGEGPLPTEVKDRTHSEEHNYSGSWQGNFRVGPLDLILLKYALHAIEGVFHLCVTHMDKVGEEIEICDAYEADPRDASFFKEKVWKEKARTINYQSSTDYSTQVKMTKALSRVKPIFTKIKKEDFIPAVSSQLSSVVNFLSFGPKTHQKEVINKF